MNSQIDTAIKRARAYWFVDGFTEIVAGLLFVALAGLLLFSQRASQASFPSWFVSAAVEISIAKLVGIIAAVLVLWWLKDHFTYPRTGFVRAKRITAGQALITLRNAVLFLLLPISGLLVVSLLITSPAGILSSMPVWFPIGISLIWAGLFMLAAGWLGLVRFRIVGGLILLAGILIGIWQGTRGLPVIPTDAQPEISQPAVLASLNMTLASLGTLVLLSGVILVLSGIFTFLQYRKENPLPAAEEA
jgi:hypothetical protein